MYQLLQHLARVGAFVAFACAGTVHATTVVSSDYDTTSTSTDVDVSCTDLDASSAGVVSAKCNKADANNNVTAASTTINVTGNIQCGMSQANDTAIIWGTGSNQYWSPKDWDVELNSTGDKYFIEAVCTSTYGVKADPSTLELGDSTNGLDNDGGSLSF